MITHYVGIDIACKTATVAWQETIQKQPTVIEIEQTLLGYHHLISTLQQVTRPQQIHVVMEATSTYWMELAYELYQADFMVSVVNPSQPKHFARSQLRRAKTDNIDALMLMDFARIMQPDIWTPPPSICETLRQHLVYRQQLIDTQGQLRSQLHAFKRNPLASTALLDRITARLHNLSLEIKELTQLIHDLLHHDHDWAQSVAYLMSIPGISTISTAWLLVATHAFQRCETPEQAASFAGLAPHPKDSGASKGYRSIGGGGHKALRNTLYMASAASARFNPTLKTFYEQLLARGKPKKVARCAVARKLIHIAWACVTKQRYFDPNYGQLQHVT